MDFTYTKISSHFQFHDPQIGWKMKPVTISSMSNNINLRVSRDDSFFLHVSICYQMIVATHVMCPDWMPIGCCWGSFGTYCGHQSGRWQGERKTGTHDTAVPESPLVLNFIWVCFRSGKTSGTRWMVTSAYKTYKMVDSWNVNLKINNSGNETVVSSPWIILRIAWKLMEGTLWEGRFQSWKSLYLRSGFPP